MQLANKSGHCTLTLDGVQLAPGATIEGDECAALVARSAGVSSMFGCGVLFPDAEAQALADRTFGAIVNGMRQPVPVAAPAPVEDWAGAAEAQPKKKQAAKAAQ